MASKSYDPQKQQCAARLKEKLDLSETPGIIITGNSGDSYQAANGLRALESSGRISVHPPGYYSWFGGYDELLKAEYYKLYYDLDKSKNRAPYILTLTLEHNGKKETAGYKWFYEGRLKSGESFLAIFFVYLFETFRGCGLAQLLKLSEITAAGELGCDFIQTYLEPHRPFFYASLIPNLKNGFVFWPGISHREEIYTAGERFLHLRKYLRRSTDQPIEVSFNDGLTFITPRENDRLIEYLIGIKSFSVSQIKKIKRL